MNIKHAAPWPDSNRLCGSSALWSHTHSHALPHPRAVPMWSTRDYDSQCIGSGFPAPTRFSATLSVPRRARLRRCPTTPHGATGLYTIPPDAKKQIIEFRIAIVGLGKRRFRGFPVQHLNHLFPFCIEFGHLDGVDDLPSGTVEDPW